MRVALVIGHSSNDQGAINENYGVSEFMFNEELANKIIENWSEYSLTDEIVKVYRETTYQDLPIQINMLEPDLIVSLHCNAFNKNANGCEMLFYEHSIKGKVIAMIFQNRLVKKLDNKDRGVKPKNVEDRGGYLLTHTKAPAIICEPFFIDNDDEYLRASECLHNGDLSAWYSEALVNALDYLRDTRR